MRLIKRIAARVAAGVLTVAAAPASAAVAPVTGTPWVSETRIGS